MRAFFKICEANGVAAGDVLARVEAWVRETDRPNKTLRALRRCIGQRRSTEQPELLYAFCREALNFDPPAGVFESREYVPDYFGEFAEHNSDFIARLAHIEGKYHIMRFGSQDIETGKVNLEKAAQRKYMLCIEAIGDQGKNFVFRYEDRNIGIAVKNPSDWEGYVFSTHDMFYLIGVEPAGADVASFVMREHPVYGFDLLTGVQFVTLLDSVPHSEPKRDRTISAARRFAAYRDNSRSHSHGALKSAAYEWISESPLGSITTLKVHEARRRD